MIVSFISLEVLFCFLLTLGTVLIKSNSGQLMLVSPQQAVTRDCFKKMSATSFFK